MASGPLPGGCRLPSSPPSALIARFDLASVTPTPRSRRGARLTDAIMSTSLKSELRDYNDRLDNRLRTRYGMTLRAFKLIKGLAQLTGAGAGIYAMSLGADPMTTFALVAIIISGPEALEFLIENGD